MSVEYLEASVAFTEGKGNSFKLLLPWQWVQKMEIAVKGLGFW